MLNGPHQDFFAIQHNRALVGSLDAGQYLNQGGFAGAVFPHQRVDFASLKGKVHIFEGMNAWEGFVDAFHCHNVVAVLGHRFNLGLEEILFWSFVRGEAAFAPLLLNYHAEVLFFLATPGKVTRSSLEV